MRTRDLVGITNVYVLSTRCKTFRVYLVAQRKVIMAQQQNLRRHYLSQSRSTKVKGVNLSPYILRFSFTPSKKSKQDLTGEARMLLATLHGFSLWLSTLHWSARAAFPRPNTLHSPPRTIHKLTTRNVFQRAYTTFRGRRGRRTPRAPASAYRHHPRRRSRPSRTSELQP